MPVEEFQRLVPDFDIFMPSMGRMAPYNILYIFVAGIILPYAAFFHPSKAASYKSACSELRRTHMEIPFPSYTRLHATGYSKEQP